MRHNKLIKARNKGGITQQQMAEMIGMEQTTYSKKERGLSPIRENEWIRLAKILEVKVEDIKNKKKLHVNSSKSLEDSNHVIMPLDVIKIIIKYNHKLEEENASLKKLLKKTSS